MRFSVSQENLIQSSDPDSLQVSTKDMDSTLSKASRAIKKTSKKVTIEKLLSKITFPSAFLCRFELLYYVLKVFTDQLLSSIGLLNVLI